MIGPREVMTSRLEHITSASRRFRPRTPIAYLIAATLLGVAVLPGAAVVPGAAEQPADKSLETNPISPGQTITIAGVCTDSTRKPLGGVDVFLVTQCLPSEKSAKVREAHTAADGRFRFDNLTAPYRDSEQRQSLAYMVVGRKLGCATAFAFVRPDSKTGGDLKLKMPPPVSLTGRVTDRDGKPLAGATVTVPYGTNDPIPGIRTARTDDQGRYEITDLAAWDSRDTMQKDVKSGLTRMEVARFPVTLAGYAKTFANYTRLPATVDVVLEREAAIEGRVVDGATGKPAASVRVSCQGIKDRGWAQVTTYGHGRYRIGGLVPDKYNVWPNVVDRTAVAIDSLEATAGKTSDAADLKLIEGGFLEGTLVDVETDKLISKMPEGGAIDVAAYGPAHPRSGAAVQSARVDQNGHFRLRVAPGVNYPYVMQPEIWKRVQRRDEYKQGIQVAEGEVARLEIHVLSAPPPKDPPLSIVRFALPVPEEREAAAAIQRLGGWYTLDDSKHVIEVNMVYHGSGPTRLKNTQFTDESLGYLPKFTKLRQIALAWKQASDEGLTHLAGAHSLREIYIWKATDVTDAGIEALRGLKDLEVVQILDAQVSDAALRTLSTLPKLQRLTVPGSEFTDEGIAYLADMKQLRWLMIGTRKSHITDAGVAHLAGLSNLDALNLMGARLSDGGLKELSGLSKLKQLHLSGGGDAPEAITDQGLQTIESLTNLEGLTLRNSRITEAGLKSLATLKRLRSLGLGSPLLSDSAYVRLRAELPSVQILRTNP
jgi:5-hydroxyisourate hydrolase-like protein (transthyretin family)